MHFCIYVTLMMPTIQSSLLYTERDKFIQNVFMFKEILLYFPYIPVPVMCMKSMLPIQTKAEHFNHCFKVRRHLMKVILFGLEEEVRGSK